MAKGLREDFAVLRSIVPWAKSLIAAAEAAERILSLQGSADSLAARKATLVADLDKARAALAAITGDVTAATDALATQRSTLEAERAQHDQTMKAARQALADEQARAREEIETARARGTQGLHDAITALRRELADLRAQKDALSKDLADTLAKYR